MLDETHFRAVLDLMEIDCPERCAALRLTEDLAIDSLDLVKLTVELGKCLNVRLPKELLVITDTIDTALAKVNRWAAIGAR